MEPNPGDVIEYKLENGNRIRLNFGTDCIVIMASTIGTKLDTEQAQPNISIICRALDK